MEQQAIDSDIDPLASDLLWLNAQAQARQAARKKLRQRFLRGFLLLCLLTILAACGSLGVRLYRYEKATEQIPFEATGWRRADPTGLGFTVRTQMKLDVIRRGKEFVGWSRADVENVFGEPTTIRNGNLVYEVGQSASNGASGAKHEFLVFVMNSKDTVSRVWITSYETALSEKDQED